ncbi:MAG: hypothetical protein A2Z78_00820 [Candidatus Nealsonbacteria bacterium RBG_13_36_15]|uniref:Uncharacterized protein n=1 Tax=Candidatus Nealsonbacteria bacterium RBG_13_36_15 TaxID=1801660 RepID=A0A1G2DVC6_9BACT|nr:MAG: hypothetical protein A2Z78_00820 [Candidatus Nealsonbacteria bacterium RBG_13_36_15]
MTLPTVGLAITAPTTTIPSPVTAAGDIITLIDNVANWLFAILLSVALLFILIAAFQFLTSGGDPARVSSARGSLMYALIGLGVAFLARGLVFLVKFVLGMA